MKATHFRIDTRRLTLRECWWQTRSPVFVVLVVLKLLRIRLPLPGILPFIARIADLEVDPATIPPATLDVLLGQVGALNALGFHSPTYYRYADSRGAQVLHIAALLHETGEVMARVMHTEIRSVQPPRRQVKVVFLSRLLDGTWFYGSAGRPEFRSPPGVQGVRRVGASPGVLLGMHRAELDRRRIANPPVLIRDRATAERFSDEYETLHQEYQVRRGLYTPVEETEVAQEQQKVAQQEQAAAEVGPDNAAVLAEVDHLLVRKPTWSGSLWMLVLSVVAFIGLGAAQWDFKFALLLVPILFIHEAGHWLAMRAFGYTNLRMFFIPLFGAAVTGRHFDVPGWKKALVSLAGPAPGILLGAAFAFSAAWMDLHGLERIIGIAILINVINLAPFLPLDGGWYLNAILFCRHPVLETGFKAFAVAGLLVAGVKTGDKIWIFLAIMLALSLGNTWRLSRLAARLRRNEVATQSTDQRTIPVATAVRIIAEVRASTSQARSNKIVAAEVLDVFERLNARPPGGLGTLALLVAYVGVAVIGFLGFGAAVLARNPFAWRLGDPEAYSRLHPLEARVSVACAGMAQWQAPWAQPARTNLVLVMANLPDDPGVQSAWRSFTNSGASRVSRMGTVIFGVFPPGRSAVAGAEALALPGTNLVSIDTRTNFCGPVPVVLHLPDEPAATRVAEELAEYFCLPGSLEAIPPWLQGAALSPAQRNARYTYRRLDEAGTVISRDPELRKAQQAMVRSFSLSQNARMQEAGAKLDAVRNRLWREVEEGLLESRDGRIVPEVVRQHRRQREELGQASDSETSSGSTDVGWLPEDGGASGGSSRSVGAMGHVRRDGARVEIRGLLFTETDLGLMALLEWLCERGCSDIRIDLMQRTMGSSLYN